MRVTLHSTLSSSPASPLCAGWVLAVVVKGLMGVGVLSIRGLWSSQCGTSNSIKGIIYVPLPITEQHGDS